MITIKRIEELARHRLVPAWAIKLVQDCVEDEAQKYPNLNCKSVQKRLATSWGYVLPEENTNE